MEIRRTVLLPAAVETVWAALTEAGRLSAWLGGDVDLDPFPGGQIVVSEDGRTAYVVNHHGAIDNAGFRQHGGRGQIAVLDIDDLLDPRNDGTAKALRQHMDSGGFGALGLVLLPELLVVANAENHLTEDGGNRITFLDRRTGSLRGAVELNAAGRGAGSGRCGLAVSLFRPGHARLHDGTSRRSGLGPRI